MTKSARTRQYILDRTAPLFNRKGYCGTSLADLTGATGLTKGALYGNFRDKEEIAQRAFDHAVCLIREQVRESLSGKDSSKARLLGLLDFYAGYVLNPPVPGGCPLLNTAVEADDHHKFLQEAVSRELNNTVSFIQQLLDKGIVDGEFKPVPDTRALAVMIFCAVEGAIMFSRVEQSNEPMHYVAGYCKKLLDQITTQQS